MKDILRRVTDVVDLEGAPVACFIDDSLLNEDIKEGEAALSDENEIDGGDNGEIVEPGNTAPLRFGVSRVSLAIGRHEDEWAVDWSCPTCGQSTRVAVDAGELSSTDDFHISFRIVLDTF